MAALISSESANESVETYSLPLIEGRVVTAHGEVTTGSIPTAEDIESLIEQSKAEGFAQGHREGIASGQQELAQCAALLNTIKKELDTPLTAIDDEVGSAIAELVAVVAKQVIRRHIELEPTEIVAIVKDAVQQLPIAQRQVSISLHPDDLAVLERVYAENNETLDWRFEADSSITQGGVIVTTEISHLDATVETRVNDVIAMMTGDNRGKAGDAP